jgi:DNA-binding winged helix-turn-helix (wHTH) protein
MNGRSEQQFLSEPRGRYSVLEGGRNGSCRCHVEADAAMQTFSFGKFCVVPHARLVERDGSPISLSSRAFDLLCLLVARPGQVVSKSELIASTWPNVTVEESSLRFHITHLRRALGDGEGGERYIVNVPGRGYCFVACVNREALPLKQGHGEDRAASSLPVPLVQRLAAV